MEEQGFDNHFTRAKQAIPNVIEGHRADLESLGLELDLETRRVMYVTLLEAFMQGVTSGETEVAAVLIEQGLNLDVKTGMVPDDLDPKRFLPDELL